MSHPLHKTIGNIVGQIAEGFPMVEVVKSNHCEEEGREIHLYCSRVKSNSTEYCDVDLIIIVNRKVIAIFEIEEPSASPITVFGKFLASAASMLAEYQPLDPTGNLAKSKVIMDELIAFAHVLGVKKGSYKPKQFDSIREFIDDNIMPVKGSSISKYKLLYGELPEFEEGRGKWCEFTSYIGNLFHELSVGSTSE